MRFTRRAWMSMLGAAAVARSAPAGLARFPYIGNLRRDRATIIWTTLDPGLGVVEYSSDLTYSRRVTANTREFSSSKTGLGFSYFQYEAELAGLRADADYFYRIVVGGQILDEGPRLHFRTAGGGPFRFLAIGDTGQATNGQLNLVPLLMQENAAMVIHTGDVVYPIGAYDVYQDFYFTPYEDLLRRVPFFLSLGNHDYLTGNGEPYLSLHAHPTETVPPQDHGRYYSFDWGDVHFVALDSNAPLNLGESGMSRMVQWLDNDLARSRQFFRVVYFHHPPFASGFNEADPLSAQVRARIVPVLDRHEVELVLTGHEHSYQRTRPMRGGVPVTAGAGTLYITTGGGGAGLVNPPARTYHANRLMGHHYLRVDVQDGRIDLRPVGLDGQAFDFVTLAPGPALGRSGVVNSASFTPSLAPGGLVSLFGRYLSLREGVAPGVPLPSELNGTKVTIGGRALPLFYASPTQVNAQLPFDVQGEVTVRVALPNGSDPVDVPVFIADVAPAIFILQAGPTRVPAIVHANGRLVTDADPAAPGEFLVVYLTGLGRVQGQIQPGTPAPASTLLRTVAPVGVRVGGLDANVQFAGLAPGFVGLYQVNVQLPDLPEGRHAFELSARGVPGTPVTIPVRSD